MKSFASGASQTTATRRLLCPCILSNLSFLFTPRPGRLRFAQTAQAGRYRSGRRVPYRRAALGTGHVSALLLLMVLREAADTSCAVTAASLRSSFFPALPPGDLTSLGRPEAWILQAVSPDRPCHLLKSETGGCGHLFFLSSSGRHMRDAPPQRSP